MRIIIPLTSPMTSESAAFNPTATKARIDRIKALIAATRAKASFKTSERAKASVARRTALVKELEAKLKASGKTTKKGETKKVKPVAKDKEKVAKVRKTSGDVKAAKKNTDPKIAKDPSLKKIERAKAKIEKLKDLVGSAKSEAGKKKAQEKLKAARAELLDMKRAPAKAPKAANAGKAVKSPVRAKSPDVVGKPKAKVDAHTGRRVITHPVKVHNPARGKQNTTLIQNEIKRLEKELAGAPAKDKARIKADIKEEKANLVAERKAVAKRRKDRAEGSRIAAIQRKNKAAESTDPKVKAVEEKILKLQTELRRANDRYMSMSINQRGSNIRGAVIRDEIRAAKKSLTAAKKEAKRKK